MVTNEDGVPVRFGSVGGGGGAMTGSVGRFRSRAGPRPTGFSIGVSRLPRRASARRQPDSRAGETAGAGRGNGDGARAHRRLPDIRRGIAFAPESAPSFYLGSSGMKAQMKYADRRGAPCVIIQGSDERERGEVQIKDLIEGREGGSRDRNERGMARRAPRPVLRGGGGSGPGRCGMCSRVTLDLYQKKLPHSEKCPNRGTVGRGVDCASVVERAPQNRSRPPANRTIPGTSLSRDKDNRRKSCALLIAAAALPMIAFASPAAAQDAAPASGSSTSAAPGHMVGENAPPTLSARS